MYVTRRRNRVLRKTNQPPLDPAKSNPSKRHRERLNGELEHLATLLPFEDSVIAKLDKLSVLRLAVSYLRAKSYYKAISPVNPTPYTSLQLDVDTQLKAINGFVIVIDPNSEVFYVSETVEQYLGFHQSDILHQSVLELVHSEDRENLSQQLNWNQLPLQSMYNGNQPDMCSAQRSESQQLLHRSFIVRFRCLLDNTSGFITMEICGHLKPLYGQTGMNGLSLFAVCTPFGPVPMGEFNLEDITFRSKHKLDMSIVSMDPRGKSLLGDLENKNTKVYDLLHPLDVHYFSDAHREMLKTGSSGLVAYRLLGKDGNWLWLQTSARVVYRNSKPDYLMCFHRNLTEEEGSNLIGKRNIEFTIPQLHTEPLADGGEYIEDLPRTPKVRKSRKASTTPVMTNQQFAGEIMPNIYDKDSTAAAANTMYYQFPSFGSTLPQHYTHPSSATQYAHQFYDPYTFSSEVQQTRQSYHLDYWHGQTTPSMLPMDPDALALALMNQQPSSYGYTHTDPQYLNSYNMSALPANTSSSNMTCMQTYGQQAHLKTDINSNPLLSFRDMTYPLLNQ